MKVVFQTKEESNKNQLDDFLKLFKAVRFFSFLRLSESIIIRFPVKHKKDKNSGNFIIKISSK